MIKRRKIRLNGEWQLDGRNQVYELRSQNIRTSWVKPYTKHYLRYDHEKLRNNTVGQGNKQQVRAIGNTFGSKPVANVKICPRHPINTLDQFK